MSRPGGINPFPRFGGCFIADAYRTARFIRVTKGRLAVQHLTGAHVAQMGAEVIPDHIRCIGFDEADAFRRPRLIEIVPIAADFAHSLCHFMNTGLPSNACPLPIQNAL